MTDETSPRFQPGDARSDSEIDALWDEDLAAAREELKRQHRLDVTLRELAGVVADAAVVTRRGREEFWSDRSLQLAGEAVISHLGEVTNRLPQSYRERHSSIPWHEIAGMRNRVIHEYQHINLKVVWRALVDEIPALAGQLDLE